jgi:hypothetical protein
MTIPVFIRASNEVVVNGDRNGIQFRSVAIKEAVIGAVVAARAAVAVIAIHDNLLTRRNAGLDTDADVSSALMAAMADCMLV